MLFAASWFLSQAGSAGDCIYVFDYSCEAERLERDRIVTRERCSCRSRTSNRWTIAPACCMLSLGMLISSTVSRESACAKIVIRFTGLKPKDVGGVRPLLDHISLYRDQSSQADLANDIHRVTEVGSQVGAVVAKTVTWCTWLSSCR